MLYNPEWKSAENSFLAKPSLAGLAYLLRHKELWPEGFHWVWVRPDCCAMGLAVEYWNLNTGVGLSNISQIFNIPREVSRDFFASSKVRGWRRFFSSRAPEPTDIASAIEKYLRKQAK